jgi:hypothetical protein
VLAFGLAGLFVSRRALRPRSAPLSRGSERHADALIIASVALPFLMLLAASVVLHPTLVGRYLLFCVPALTIALAALIDRLVSVAGPRRVVAIGTAALLGLAGVRGSLSWHVDSHTEQWNRATAYVFDHARADDRLVIANDSIRLFFEYERSRRSPLPVGPTPGFPSQPWGQYGTGNQRYESPTAEELAEAAAGAPRLWVVIGHDHTNTSIMTVREQQLAPAFKLLESHSFKGSIEVQLYERVTS